MIPILTQRYFSPCGEMILGSYDGRLCLCDWTDGRRRDVIDSRLRTLLRSDFVADASDVTDCARLQLEEYFDGRRNEFSLPLLLAGSDFQKRVWSELMHVPYGSTVSYSDVARRIGLSGGVRAVANAIGSNAISVIVPCHRVIGSNGALTGYGGGLGKKRFLLELEK